MQYTVITMILILVLSVSALATDIGVVPFCSPPLLNGIKGEGEWQGACTIDWEKTAGTTLLMQDSLYIYMCFVDHDTIHSGIDLYIDNLAGDILMLHVSSARGQSRLFDNNWSEMKFGSQELWTSNILDNIHEDGKMIFLSPDLFEFQIDKKLFSFGTFKFMTHLKRPEIWIPSEADTLITDDWIEVELYK